MTYQEKYNNISYIMKNKNPQGGCTEQEYSFIADEIMNLNGGNILVFGLGYDSFLYTEANRDGHTVFIENSGKWIDKMKPTLTNSHSVVRVEYNTKRWQWKEFLGYRDCSFLYLNEIPPEYSRNIDLIFVDSPHGCGKGTPGRMKSLYTASVIGRNSGSKVLIHDIDRTVEKEYSERFIQPYSEYKTKMDEGGSKIWIYKMKGENEKL